jgi:uncharacterized protein YcfJ
MRLKTPSIAREWDCYTKEFRQRVSGDGSATNEIFGGILGGAIGNQFGGGSGKKIMTAAGACCLLYMNTYCHYICMSLNNG